MVQVVWFKRDLRTYDHEPLVLASQKGSVLPLYILEPKLWSELDMSGRQYLFLKESLADLDCALRAIGQPLIIAVGDALTVFKRLHNSLGIQGLWSHQETGNAWTYKRDIAVQKWVNTMPFTWYESLQHGVIRQLKNRDTWSSLWYQQMKKTPLLPPKQLAFVTEHTASLPTAQELGLIEGDCPFRQQGGRQKALELVQSFLHQRGQYYTKQMSSPLTAFDSCSRLSPHLAFGTLSMRELFYATNKRSGELKNSNQTHKAWSSAIRSFHARLRWHCHFIQKLEDQPSIEFQAMHPAYDDLRDKEGNQSYFEAWKTGHTGYPMIDASMRALIATGWLNFRMRAMLVSFASYHLWLDFRLIGPYLASLFTDYEPGIHYSQLQMQSGTTGINALRIYNPIKQGLDQDPQGSFIKHWVPELRSISTEFIHSPWLAPNRILSYPPPIVDEKQARKWAADKVYSLRKQTKTSLQTRAVVKKHASRKPHKPRKSKPSAKHEGQQMELF